MKPAKSQSVTLKLGFAFVVLIAILLGIGWLGFSRMALMNGNIQEITDQLVEDAIAMNYGAFERHGVCVERRFSPAPPARVDRHKVLQILINLLRNAKYALDEVERLDKRITISIEPVGEHVRIAIADNGIGIPPENLDRIFGHGFTTRKDGHGFGLHSGANAAREIGGTLSAHSDGLGLGTTFTLELPAAAHSANA